MEDGTLHRFRASNTILATGVRGLPILKYCFFLFFLFFAPTLVMNSLLLYEHRVMAGHISQQPQHTLVLEMAMLWLHVLVYLFRPVFSSRVSLVVVGPCFYPDYAYMQLQDLEFVQFHPTGIYGAGCLITEGCIYSTLPVLSLGNSFVCEQLVP
jgi:hypothetical protein